MVLLNVVALLMCIGGVLVVSFLKRVSSSAGTTTHGLFFNCQTASICQLIGDAVMVALAGTVHILFIWPIIPIVHFSGDFMRLHVCLLFT